MAASIKKTLEVVRVACRLPHGLDINLSDGRTVKLKGAHSAFILPPGTPRTNVSSGHGFTDIPADLWAQIVMEHADRPYLKNRFVFAGDEASVRDEVKDRNNINAGFNGIDQANPSSAPGLGLAEIQKEGGQDRGLPPGRG